MPTDDQQEHSSEPWLLDVHTHAFDPGLPDFGSATARVPSVTALADGRIQVHFDGRPYRIMDERSWSPEVRLADMDAQGVRTQVVSPFPVTFCHDVPPEVAAALARRQNQFLEGFHRHSSNRFAVLGAVPLQDADAAAAEVTRVVGELGFAGVAIGTEVSGTRLSAPSLSAFWQAADELRAVVLVHPVDHCVDPRIRDAGLGFGLGMPTETALAGLDVLTSGLLAKYPDVRICLSHGGGALPAVLPRAAFGQSLGLGPQPDGGSVLQSAKRLWIDSLTYDADALAVAARRFGSDHVVFGSDYPGAAPTDLVATVVHDTGMGPAFAQAVGAQNAVDLLGVRHPRLRPAPGRLHVPTHTLEDTND